MTPPYEERRKGLIAKSFLNICSFDNNHPTKITLQDDVKFSFNSKNIKTKQKPYYITAQEVLKENNYIPDNIYSHSECPTPHGIYKNPWSKPNCMMLFLKRTSLI